MTKPLDPTDRAAMIEWARTPFRENDYLTVRAMQDYDDPSSHGWGVTRAGVEDALFAGAEEMYRAVVPSGYVVIEIREAL